MQWGRKIEFNSKYSKSTRGFTAREQGGIYGWKITKRKHWVRGIWAKPTCQDVC